MFWKFNLITQSHIDTLLEKEDVTLHELMDEDDILQECKAQNKKLLDFIVRPENMKEMVRLITEEPPEDMEEKIKYKYPNTACELLTSDVSQINDRLSGDPELIQKLYSFLESEDQSLNPLLASFFSKVMGILITRKSEMIFEFLKSKEDFVGSLLYHLGTSAIMDLLLRLITCIESPEIRRTVIEWLNEKQIVEKLVGKIHSSMDEDIHCNASQSLCDIIRLGRDQMSQLQERADPDPLLMAIESENAVTKLLENMLTGEQQESVIVNGLSVIQTLLEFRKQGPEGMSEQMTELDKERLSQGVDNALTAIKPRLKDFHHILLNPPKQNYSQMPTTMGTLEPPLGNCRLQISRLLTALVITNTHSVNVELAKLGTVEVLMDLFFTYSWNNFLHTQVELCIGTILNNSPSEVDGQKVHPLLTQLLTDCKFLQKTLDNWEKHDVQENGDSGKRCGYMGHLTKIVNDLKNSLEKGENSECLKQQISEVPEDYRKKWETFVTATLEEVNKRNTVELVRGHPQHSSSEDDDPEFNNITFPQDAAMQQAFSDYQLQQMTTNFIDQFGFNEEEFAEQEEKEARFTERISSIDFNIQANEDTQPNSTMFEQVCNEQIPQLDDNDSDEDIWEEKEITFAQASQARTCRLPDRSNGDSDDSTDSEEDLDSPKRIVQQPNAEKMDVDSNEANWTPTFDVPMDAAPIAMETASPWDTAPVQAPVEAPEKWADFSNKFPPQNEENWADFRTFTNNFSDISNTDPAPRVSSPVAMDTAEVNSHPKYLSRTAPADLAGSEEPEKSDLKEISTEDTKNDDVVSNSTSVSFKSEVAISLSGSGDGDQVSTPSPAESHVESSPPTPPHASPEVQVPPSNKSKNVRPECFDEDQLNANFDFLASAGLIKSPEKAIEPVLQSAEIQGNGPVAETAPPPVPEVDEELEKARTQAKEALDTFESNTAPASVQNGPV